MKTVVRSQPHLKQKIAPCEWNMADRLAWKLLSVGTHLNRAVFAV
ncbi:hypothetical protein B4123_0511 [Bacillus paralicheniformis]|nr:hypothetical protein B4123_2569 [Bacillus paralicheniformis]OLG13089.1 hypothetical protein B4123_0511 [Bacillus paralicheniformis]TWJ52164.1 hypothetical protein CHCC5023_4285 [Bacillus paralicheniformis]TWJ70733.1 hypothetical protein CHCC5019_3794 [Bacillus paralicheniformis]TWN86731.1 hypothetical protein CHCC20490_4266 [Bacillus paralicheniformis]